MEFGVVENKSLKAKVNFLSDKGVSCEATNIFNVLQKLVLFMAPVLERIRIQNFNKGTRRNSKSL